MSDSEDYEYEYDESDQEAMDDGGNGDDEEQSFEYTDDEDNTNQPDGEEGGEIALENAYYNAKGERDNDELDVARETFESVVRMEVAQNKKAAGVEEQVRILMGTAACGPKCVGYSVSDDEDEADSSDDEDEAQLALGNIASRCVVLRRRTN